MAFAVSNASPSMAEMNITPLVDVMLVLLVIFMVTAPMLEQRLTMLTPQVTPPRPEQLEPLRLTINAGDVYQLGDQSVSRAQLQQLLEQALAQDARSALNVHIDADADYQSVVDALAMADRVGIPAGLAPQ